MHNTMCAAAGSLSFSFRVELHMRGIKPMRAVRERADGFRMRPEKSIAATG
jgi:hypothetical protein